MSSSALICDSRMWKKCKFVRGGLELPNKLIYHRWEPGGEYTLPLILKNVKLTTQKLTFKLSSKQFTVPVSQQSLVLCAGTSCTIPITFRPCGKNPCEEFIEFETSDGMFISVPLRAVLPRPVLKLTEHLNFGMCAVKSSICVNFEMSNVGNVPAFYSWKVPCGFNILPKSGLLTPKETFILSARFSPEIAKIYGATATCVFGEHKDTKDDSLYMNLLKLTGTGKYPHVAVQHYSILSNGASSYEINKSITKNLKINTDYVQDVNELTVDFGCVAVRHSDEKWISVSNPSPVSCNFSVCPYLTSPDNMYFSVYLSAERGNTLQPSCSTKVKLVYAPVVLRDYQDIGYFTVQADGGHGSTKIKCLGQSKGPKVCVLNEKSIVNFGNIECGRISVGKIYLSNQSDVSALYQLHIKPNSVFECDIVNGELEGHSSMIIPVNFVPQNPVPYYRTISLIVLNQEPLFVHFIGTGYSEVQHPAQIYPRDISNYLIHAESGISLIPPGRLGEYIEKGMIEADSTCGYLKPTSKSNFTLSSLPKKFTHYSSGYEKYLYSGGEMSMIPHITSDVEMIKFGYCSPSFSSDSKGFTICNHTYGEVSCVWMTANLKNFVIIPSERILLPRKSASFSIFFKPDKFNQFYNTEVECFVFYKDLYDSSRVDRLTLCPPWCCTVKLSGHTFVKDLGDSLSELSFEAANITFPSTIPGQPVYQTITIRNPGKEQIHYYIPEDKDKIFTMKPCDGIISGEFELVTIQMIPKEAKQYKVTLEYQLQSTSAVYYKKLSLCGFSETPNITLENEGQLFVKPTCIGTMTSQQCAIRNSSKLPLCFEWKQSNLAQSKVLHVKPSMGTIFPNEIQEHIWYFTPMDPRAYEMRSVLHSFVNLVGKASQSVKKQKTILDIFGVGTTGILKCLPSRLDFGIMITGTSKHHHILLSNPGPCDLQYALIICHSTTADNEVEVSPMEGVIYAQSTIQVKVIVRSFQNASHKCTINYELISQISEAKSHVLCEVDFAGTFPSLTVADIRSGGIASQVSKSNWWKMLSIDKINASLSDTPSATELQYDISSKHSLKHQIPIRTKAIVNCDFGAAPLGSEECIIYFQLKNDGVVATEWAFLMSTDLWLEPDYWADYGLAEKVEEDEMHVLNHELFMVSPKQGHLEPGKVVVITITYKHSQVGVHKLPVLFKINKGREIMLNWSGVTLERGLPHLHISCKEHVFEAVPICTHSYPIQIFPLYNGGDTAIGYEVDVRPLYELTETNYFMPIFECLQPMGKILPGKTLHLEFIFSPLEAIKYSIDVPIHLSTGNTTIVTLVGEGYDHNFLKVPYEYKQNIPISGSITLPKCVAHLSHDIIKLGNVPQFSAVRRIVFICNTSSHTISYLWELESDKVISVEPSTGHIQPGKNAACKVTFCSQFPSFNYNFDLLCNIIDESELSRYQATLFKWRKKKEANKQSLVFTHANIRMSSKQLNKPVPEEFSDDAFFYQNQTAYPSNDSELCQKLDTLPPIGKSQEEYEEWKKKDLSKKIKKRSVSNKVTYNEPPVCPKPILLHLSVTAKVISLADYVQLYDDLDIHHIDHHALSLQKDNIPFTVYQDDLNFQRTVLNQILNEVLEDSSFQQALCRIVEEPVPYFSQFSTHTIKREKILSTEASSDSTDYEEKAFKVNCESKENESGRGHLDTRERNVHEDVATKIPLNFNSDPFLDDSEIYSILEEVMDNTLINIFIEANAREFILNQPLYNVKTGERKN